MAEKEAGKQHICYRMLQYIKGKGLKPTPWEEANGVGRGYLKQSAEANRNIGLEIVESFILFFPEVDANWLVTGKPLGDKNNKKHTAATNSDEAAVSAEKDELMKDLAVFRSLVVSQQETILNLSRAQAPKEA